MGTWLNLSIDCCQDSKSAFWLSSFHTLSNVGDNMSGYKQYRIYIYTQKQLQYIVQPWKHAAILHKILTSVEQSLWNNVVKRSRSYFQLAERVTVCNITYLLSHQLQHNTSNPSLMGRLVTAETATLILLQGFLWVYMNRPLLQRTQVKLYIILSPIQLKPVPCVYELFYNLYSTSRHNENEKCSTLFKNYSLPALTSPGFMRLILMSLAISSRVTWATWANTVLEMMAAGRGPETNMISSA